jgi:filamentous hemagglutinin
MAGDMVENGSKIALGCEDDAATRVADAIRGIGAAAATIGGIGAVKNAGSRGKAPSVDWPKQEKHFPGHNSHTPGRSQVTADPEKLAAKAGTGQQVGKVPVGLPGSKERVDFGERIGTHIDPAGVSSPTTKGIIHHGKNGIHVVPAKP